MSEQIQNLLISIGSDGRLVFMPSDGQYRAVHSGGTISPDDVSTLLKGRLIEKAGTMAGVYKLSDNGRAALAGSGNDA